MGPDLAGDLAPVLTPQGGVPRSAASQARGVPIPPLMRSLGRTPSDPALRAGPPPPMGRETRREAPNAATVTSRSTDASLNQRAHAWPVPSGASVN